MSGFYNPAPFRLEDPVELGRLIETIVFADLVTNGPQGPQISHLPFLLDRESGPEGTLRAHLAAANDHWRTLDDAPALVVFRIADHYVTPSWYASKARTGKVVPTWNYVTVHARGRARVHRDPARLRRLVEDLTARMEADRPQPWSVGDAPEDYVGRLIEQIVGVDVALDHLEGKIKLGQNRSAADRASLAGGLQRERPRLWRVLEALRPTET